MAVNPVLANMRSVIETITCFTTYVTANTAQVQTLVTAAGINATVTTTASTFAITPGQLKVKDIND